MKSSTAAANVRKLFFLSLLLLLPSALMGQTTEFKFSGDTGTAFSGALDMEFRLYNALTDGSQIGSTLLRSAVTVENGKFSAVLDYGDTAFAVVDRWIEVRTSPVGAGSYTVLNPRSKVISTPRAIVANYAISADLFAGLEPSEWTRSSDPRLSDARPPTAGSTHYIQNSTTHQLGATFNISGLGKAGTLLASTVTAAYKFDLGSYRILFANGDNTFGGWQSGLSNTSYGNTAFGYSAATSIASGSNNTMFGNRAGYDTVSGSENVMFGSHAGRHNTASFNSYVGSGAGRGTTSGDRNVFVGYDSGYKNTTGVRNTIVGASSGTENLTGGSNSFFGNNAGYANTSGSNNTALGANTNVGSNLSFASAIGAGASVTTSGTIVIGRPSDRVEIGGLLRVSLGPAGSNHVCRNSNFELSTCSSSIRYKSNVIPFTRGLDLVSRLNPVSFKWKGDGSHDLGLVAEEVNKVEPLLTNLNERGEIEGVKYDRVAVVLLNAVHEQQIQIDAQRRLVEQQQQIINDMRVVMCRKNPKLKLCQARLQLGSSASKELEK